MRPRQSGARLPAGIGGHSGQMSPIVSSMSRTAATARSGETPGGGSWRATRRARAQAWGSARSFVQPCSSHSWIAPASIRTDLAHPSIVRKAGRRSFVIRIAIAPRCTQDESLGSCRRSALLSKGRDSELRAFSDLHLSIALCIILTCQPAGFDYALDVPLACLTSAPKRVADGTDDAVGSLTRCHCPAAHQLKESRYVQPQSHAAGAARQPKPEKPR